jgi:hypothetical protein
MKIRLRDNETILKEGGANHFKGVEAVGGKLWLTNLRLFFKSHFLNAQPHEESYYLNDLVSVQPVNTLNLVPNGIKVTLKDGRTERFVVNQRQDWLTNISSKLVQSQTQQKNSSPEEIPNSDVQVILTQELERVRVGTEDIQVPVGVTVRVTKSRTFEHSLELKQNDVLEGKLELEVGVEAGVKAVTRGSILKKIEQLKGQSYKGSETVSYEIELSGAKATRYQLIWTDVWRQVLVSLPEYRDTIIPFRFRESTELNVLPVEPIP